MHFIIGRGMVQKPHFLTPEPVSRFTKKKSFTKNRQRLCLGGVRVRVAVVFGFFVRVCVRVWVRVWVRRLC